jgi:hypothetical protein
VIFALLRTPGRDTPYLRPATRRSATRRIVAGVLVSGLALAGCGDGSGSSSAADRDGHFICRGIGAGQVGAYRQTADGLPRLRDIADRLRDSGRWHAVGVAVERLVALGPTTEWSSADVDSMRSTLADLTDACRTVSG